MGNWPGKTVERAEGSLAFRGYEMDIIDLPGIYSLSTYSIEELVSREYIAVEQPDVLVNVVDATSLERNLFFTIQLLELRPRMIIALNQMDMAEEKGIEIDVEKLESMLGVPVIPTVAVSGRGLQELMDKAVESYEERANPPEPPNYGVEIEQQIQELEEVLEDIDAPYPKRWIAIKLLEEDKEIEEKIYPKNLKIRKEVERVSDKIEEIHGHDTPSVIASERYALANKISDSATQLKEPKKTLGDRLSHLTSHPIYGYLFLATVMILVFYSIFSFGDYISSLLEIIFGATHNAYQKMFGSGPISNFIWSGLIEGAIAGITIALPYIIPFYIALSILEDSGYLARVAFLMDSVMHQIGLHGKGFIPLMLGFGCNVPACLGCRIMETEREQLICAFIASLVPCAARSIVIMGLVAEYVGFEWAITLYIIDFFLIFALGRTALGVVPGEPMGLIMDIPPYRWPSLKVTITRTWLRLKDFIYNAFPVIILGNLAIYFAKFIGLLDIVQGILKPITVLWLGLPAATGVILIFGILRKELTLILLASLMGTSNFAKVLTPLQMFVFAFVVMVYIPCIATIAALVKEFGYKRAITITIVEIVLAISLGGILSKILPLLGLP